MAKFVCNVISYSLVRTVDITVIIPSTTIPESMQMQFPGMENAVPPTHEVKEKYPVLYLLHGMGNNHAQWGGYTNIEMFAEERNIAGLSMGGYGALLHGLSNPERFAAIGTFSGAVMPVGNPEQMKELVDGPLDVKWLAKKAVEDGKKLPPLYVTCGEEDMLYQVNTEFKDYLKELGIDVTWISVPGYTHEWRFWNLAVEEFLKWIPRTDYYAALGTRKI